MRALSAVWAIALFVLASAPSALAADLVSAKAEQVSVVVYPSPDAVRYGGLYSGLAMITERRTVTLPAGPSTIQFRGVAEGIVPQTVAVQGLPDKVAEQNFDYRLLSPGSLIRQAADQIVTVVRTNPVTGKVEAERAKVISAGQGVMLDFEGRIEALRCSALSERVVLDSLPGGLVDKPTLSLQTTVPKAGTYRLTLSYLATGVSWSAAYVASLNPKGSTLDLTAWVTIGNFTSTAFDNAPVQVLAGRLSRSGATAPVPGRREFTPPNCWPVNSGRFTAIEVDSEAEQIVVTGAVARAPPPPPPPARPAPPPPGIAPENLGDYKLYNLPEPTTLAAHQVKQLTLLERRNVAYERIFRVEQFSVLGEANAQPKPAKQVLRLSNEKKAGLGLPLPAGQVAVVQRSATGRRLLLGEDRVRDTAEHLPLEIVLGEAVNVDSYMTSEQRADYGPGGSSYRWQVTVVLTNARAEPVVAEVREYSEVRGFKVLSEDHPHELRDGKTQWRVTIPANGETILRYALERIG